MERLLRFCNIVHREAGRKQHAKQNNRNAVCSSYLSRCGDPKRAYVQFLLEVIVFPGGLKVRVSLAFGLYLAQLGVVRLGWGLGSACVG